MLKQFLTAFVLLCILPVCPAYAKDYDVKGIVTDSELLPLSGATVVLVREKDSSLSVYSTDTAGKFHFTHVYSGNYLLKISFIGFQSFEKKIIIDKQSINLGTIRLNLLSSTLNEVKVVANAPPVVQKGDTTEFNAGSFKTNPDASTEDLVRKMPGIDMSDGKVKAQGQNINKVLVDGKPFFGDDPMIALKTLPAEMVDKIQVFDSKSDQARFTGIDDGQTSKTMNVVTKADKREGRFGKVAAGYGDQDRYMTGLNLNDFNGNRRTTVTALANNINMQNFSTQDNGNKSQGNQQSGISTTQSAGINYSDTWGKKTNATASYFLSHSNNQSDVSLLRNYLLTSDSGLNYNQQNQATNETNTHKLSFRIEHTIDSANSLVLTPAINIQQNNFTNGFNGQTNGNTGLLNQIVNTNSSETKGYDLSNEALFMHRFRKKRRTISLNLHTSYANSSGGTNLRSQNLPADTNNINQNANIDQKSWMISGNGKYIEPLGAKHFAQFGYLITVQENQSDKKTYNFSDQTGQYILPDSSLTNGFKNRNISHKPDLTWQWQNSKLTFMAGAAFQWLQMQNTQLVPRTSVSTRTYGNLLPTASIKYKISAQQNVTIAYNSSTNQPSINQLQQVVNNANPLQLSTGNPSLKQARQQNLRLNWYANSKSKTRTFFLSLSATSTKNFFATSTSIAGNDIIVNGKTILKRGGQLSIPVNLDGSYSLSAMVNYNLPVRFIKSNLSTNGSYTFTRNPGVANGTLTYNAIQLASAGVTLSSNVSKELDFTASTSARYNSTSNSLQPGVRVQSFNQSSRASLYWMFAKKFVYITELNHQAYFGLSGGFNQQYLLWNMALAKKFMKKNQLELKLSVFDLLKQNNNIQRNVSTIYYEDVRTTVLQRYFMLTVSYNIRDFGK